MSPKLGNDRRIREFEPPSHLLILPPNELHTHFVLGEACRSLRSSSAWRASWCPFQGLPQATTAAWQAYFKPQGGNKWNQGSGRECEIHSSLCLASCKSYGARRRSRLLRVACTVLQGRSNPRAPQSTHKLRKKHVHFLGSKESEFRYGPQNRKTGFASRTSVQVLQKKRRSHPSTQLREQKCGCQFPRT